MALFLSLFLLRVWWIRVKSPFRNFNGGRNEWDHPAAYALRNTYSVYGVATGQPNVCVKPKARDYRWLKYRQGSTVAVVVVLVVVVVRTTCLRIKTSCLSWRSAGLLFGGLWEFGCYSRGFLYCPLPPWQTSNPFGSAVEDTSRLSPYRAPPQKKKEETKREHPLSLSTRKRAREQMIAEHFRNTMWQIVGKEKRYRQKNRSLR